MDILEDHSVIHCRGTPSCGKTTLAGQLDRRLRNEGKTVAQLTWLRGVPYLQQLVEALFPCFGSVPSHRRAILELNVTIIIDEAQDSYGDVLFWNDFVKSVHGDDTDVRLILFCAYGSPTQGPISSSMPMTGTPAHFGAEQRVGLLPSSGNSEKAGLFFTNAEYRLAIDKLLQHPDKKIPMTADCISLIWQLTLGHPGAVRSVAKSLGIVSNYHEYFVSCYRHVLIIREDESFKHPQRPQLHN